MKSLPVLKIQLPGLSLDHPLILSSGILGGSPWMLLRAQQLGAAAAVTKSLTKHPIQGWDGPRLIKLDFGVLNAMGMANPGLENYLSELKSVLSKLEIPIICSLAARDLQEFEWLVQRIEPDAFCGMELNLSCPNVPGYGAELGSNPKLVRELISRLRDLARVPLWVKLPPVVPLIKDLGRAAQDGGAAGLVATNTLGAIQIDLEFRKPSLGAKLGGLSGAALKPVALRCVYELYESVEIPIIGCGGILSWRDAAEYLMAGASAIQIGSGLLENPRIFHQIRLGLRLFLEQQGYGSISELVGIAHA